jgi:fatty acid desaturase
MQTKDWPMEKYLELKELLIKEKLLDRNYIYYMILSTVTICLTLVSLYLLKYLDNLFLIVIDAIVFAFFSVQVGMLGHDLSHNQVFQNSEKSVFCKDMLESFWGSV